MFTARYELLMGSSEHLLRPVPLVQIAQPHGKEASHAQRNTTRSFSFVLTWNPANTAFTILLTLLFLVFLLLLLTLTAQPAWAQTFTVLHNFANGEDGELPYGTPMVDAWGNVYGTALGGRTCIGCPQPQYSPLYKLSHNGSGWVFTTAINLRYPSFTGLVYDANGVLYGTEVPEGLIGGTVYELRRSSTSHLFPWTETALHYFGNGSDGNSPNDLTIDSQGNLYGTTEWDGTYGGGTVFKLTRTGSGWTYNVLYELGGSGGSQPGGRVAVDAAGNVYGTTWSGGNYDCGVIFEVTPAGRETVLHYFNSDDGCGSASGLIFDPSGNLYGAAAVLYELSPGPDGWSFRQVYRFPDGGSTNLALDPAGSFYGAVTFGGPTRSGEVFKLTPGSDGWTYTVLHDFSGPDGWGLYAGVALDANGNLFGAASQGGAYNYGVVFEITPQ